MSNYPLMCWDIFVDGWHRRMQLADDLKALHKIMHTNNWQTPGVALDNTLVWQNKVIVITDARLNIVHATENIFAMSGYMPYEVIGKNRSVLQGNVTTLEESIKIKEAVDDKKSFETVITNYKKDGTLYKCHIEGYPIFNKQGVFVNFLAIEQAA